MLLLELAVRTNSQTTMQKSARILASDYNFMWKRLHGKHVEPKGDFDFSTDMSPAFSTLSPDAAVEVLRKDELGLTSTGTTKEIRVVQLVVSWLIQKPANPERATLLLDCIRFGLLSFSEMTRLQDELASLTKLSEVSRNQLRDKLVTAFRAKLAVGVHSSIESAPKRKFTLLTSTTEEEERSRKMLRTALEMCVADHRGATSSSAGSAHPPG